MPTEQNYIQFCLGFAQAYAQLSRRWDRTLSAHGISFTEFLILNQLAKSPSQHMRRVDLAESISITASGVTRLLAPMEKIGLVEKETNQRDARVSLVKITKTGEQILADATQSLGGRSLEHLQQLNLGELAQNFSLVCNK